MVDRRLRGLTIAVVALSVMTAARATALLAAGRDDPSPGASAAVEVPVGDGTTRPPVVATDVTVAATTLPAPTTSTTTRLPAPGTTSSSPASVRPCTRLRALPTRAKLAQLLLVGVSDAGTAQAALSGPSPAGGVMVLGKGSTWFANGVLKTMATAAAVPPVVAADEEGGRVQRIDAIHGPMVSAYRMGRMPPPRIRALARDRGTKLRALGFTMDLAPVVDLYDRNNAVINNRAFDADPQKVIAAGEAFAAGLQDAGITPVLKHFPGHGRSTGDSHKQAVRTPSVDELRRSDLQPFQALAEKVPAVMVGHLDVPGLTEPGRPTSVSKAAIGGLLRGEIGFGGLVITDDLSGMKAITNRFTVPEAVVASISAGADVAIIVLTAGQTLAPMLSSLEAAVTAGTLSMTRVDDALDHLGAAKPACR